MQKLLRILFIFILSHQVPMFAQGVKQHFEYESFEQARAASMRAEKPLMAFFTAEWVMPCQWMEMHTFTELRVQELLQNAYTGVRIDIDGVSGKAIKKRFGVTKLPTILIFDARGTLKKTIEESVSGTVLADELEDFLSAYGTGPAAPVATIEEDPGIALPVPILEISRPAIIPETHNSPKLVYYTIQIGVYSDSDNALKARQRINQFSDLEVSIVEHLQNGLLTYKVMAGSFTDQELAHQQLLKLRSYNIYGLVKPVP